MGLLEARIDSIQARTLSSRGVLCMPGGICTSVSHGLAVDQGQGPDAHRSAYMFGCFSKCTFHFSKRGIQFPQTPYIPGVSTRIVF